MRPCMLWLYGICLVLGAQVALWLAGMLWLVWTAPETQEMLRVPATLLVNLGWLIALVSGVVYLWGMFPFQGGKHAKDTNKPTYS